MRGWLLMQQILNKEVRAIVTVARLKLQQLFLIHCPYVSAVCSTLICINTSLETEVWQTLVCRLSSEPRGLVSLYRGEGKRGGQQGISGNAGEEITENSYVYLCSFLGIVIGRHQ